MNELREEDGGEKLGKKEGSALNILRERKRGGEEEKKGYLRALLLFLCASVIPC